MCTAISVGGASAIFGRTLDLEYSYGYEAVILPRGAALEDEWWPTEHFAIIGTAYVSSGVPLLFDAMNEHGLCAAALNFPVSAVYLPPVDGRINIPSYALIPYVLSTCPTLSRATELLRRVNITPDSFSPDLPATPMHWIFSDGRETLIAEPMSGGLRVMPSYQGVLTNEPPYDYQLMRLSELMSLSPGAPENRLFGSGEPKIYSGAMASIGLPGDFSSSSRLVRAVYAAKYTESDGSKWGEVSRFFHIADTVSVPDGCSINTKGKRTRTVYTVCYDITHRCYYVRTYDSHRIFRLSLTAIAPDSREMLRAPHPKGGFADALAASPSECNSV